MSHPINTENFVLGLDLDGTCADFYGAMRVIAAEWTGRPLEDLDPEPQWSMENWGIGEAGYEDFHRFAVTQRSLFEAMDPLPGAPQAIRRLATEGVRIRVITHRLVIPFFHVEAVTQTVRWLDSHGIPYWDLCFMREKDDVDADLYVEDSVKNIERLLDAGAEVLVMTNGANRSREFACQRAESWDEAEGAIRFQFYAWLDERGLERPSGPGVAPVWLQKGNAPPRQEH